MMTKRRREIFSFLNIFLLVTIEIIYIMKLYILYQLFKLIKNSTVWFLLNGSVRRIKIPCTLIQAIHQPRTELMGERNESLDR